MTRPGSSPAAPDILGETLVWANRQDLLELQIMRHRQTRHEDPIELVMGLDMDNADNSPLSVAQGLILVQREPRMSSIAAWSNCPRNNPRSALWRSVGTSVR